MKKIKLGSKKYPNQYALVDDEDYDYINKWNWYCFKGKGAFYAVRMSSYRGGKKKTLIYMHRVIANCPDNYVVDHINHIGVDNQKQNLRVCSLQQNNINCKSRYNSSSKYKGVTYLKCCKRTSQWRAQIQYKYKSYYLGSYLTEKEAALAYNKAAVKLHGEFCFLNEV
jgi:hypothetical protein